MAENTAGTSESSITLTSLKDLGQFFSPQTEDSQTEEPKNTNPTVYNNTYTLIALMMYLTGIEKRHFENHDPDIYKEFEKYEKNPNARIIRNLCMIRTSLIRHGPRIADAFYYDIKNLSTLPDLIPTDAVMQLSADGIELQKSKPDVTTYIIAINRELSNRVNNIQTLFPDWLNWDYIRPLFIMPNGMKNEGVKDAREFYNNNFRLLPFQIYINWDGNSRGNLFSNDAKFVTVLYENHEDRFENKSLVVEIQNDLVTDLYEFIGDHSKSIMVVDCENVDPVKLAAALSSFTPAQRSHIYKVMLFDSEYTTSTWATFCKTGITENFNSEHYMVGRVVEHKSQVDMTLAARTCKEVYQNDVDSVILVSSDSDYWALINTLSEVDFLVMLEWDKTGGAIVDTLKNNHYSYCYLDNFCINGAYNIKMNTVLSEAQYRLDSMVDFNAHDFLDQILHNTWVNFTDKEKKNFYDRYLKNMRLKIDTDGNVRIVIEP